jgi:NADH-quinone oxidoreductase subunit L
MVARCHPLFVLAPAALQTVAVIGAITAIFAASIGLVQTDIKKILAYSTISQLGFMFLGCGVGAFAAGIFHLMTHAFFKALLFLGAGSVIHALGGEQDIRKMGALKNKIPTTWWTMMAGTLAITGFFPFAGFFSKDEILWQTLIRGHWLLWVIGMIAATMTSFYMFRMMFLTFYGKSRRANEAGHQVHESPSCMTVPLQILAIGSLVVGWVGIPHGFHLPNFLENFLMPFFLHPGVTEVHRPTAGLEWLAMGLSLGVAATGLLLAYGLYLQKPYLPEKLSQTFQGLYATLLNKYWVDEFYNLVIVKPILIGSKYLLWKVFDVLIVDGSVNGTSKLVYCFGNGIKRFQSGFIRTYAAWILLGSAVVIAYFVYVH